jgi:UDP-glucose 4-epimerase
LKVVITGASGFLGKYILKELNKKNDIEIIPVSRKKIPGWVVVSDYSDSPVADILIHLAQNNNRALTNQLGKSHEEKTIKTFINLLSKDYSRVIYISSSVLYGDKQLGLLTENNPIEVIDTYTQIKYRSELEVFSKQFGLTIRLANVYGPGMSKSNVLSNILNQIPGKGSLQVMDCKPIRDFIWAEDVAKAIVELTFNNSSKEKIFNVGTGIGTSIESLASLALGIAGESDRLVYESFPVNRRSSVILDSSLTKYACGWVSETSLECGLKKMLSITKKNLKDE